MRLIKQENDQMKDVLDYIYKYDGFQREVMLYFHQRLTKEMGLTDKVRFNLPFYFKKSWVCYLTPIKAGFVELAFLRGNELSNTQGILNSKGRKQVYGIEFKTLSSLQSPAIDMVIQEAILLDDTVPYKSKRKK